MKRRTSNFIRLSWTNRNVITTLVMVCFVCPLFDIPSSESQCQPIVLASANLGTSAKTPKEIEYEVKAAFIYNFMKFVEWPPEKNNSEDSDSNPENRMVIGILGVNPFGSAFGPILDKEVHGRKIHLLEIPSYQRFYETSGYENSAQAAYQAKYQNSVRSCDVLFICDSERNHVSELLDLAAGNHILTVSDLPGFARRGGIIGFVKDNNKIRFEINLDAAQKENIKIRSQLLTLAKEVYSSK